MARQTKIFGARLKKAREAKCLTQSQLGAALGGMSDENIGRIERNEVAGIMTKHLPNLAAALGMTVDKLRESIVAPDDGKTGRPGRPARIVITGSMADELTDIAAQRGTTPLALIEPAIRVVITRLSGSLPPEEPIGEQPPGVAGSVAPPKAGRKTAAGKSPRKAPPAPVHT